MDANLSITIEEVYTLTQYLETAIKRKTFTKDEITKLYPVWTKVARFCEELKRKVEVDKLYKDENENPSNGTSNEKPSNENLTDNTQSKTEHTAA